MAIVLPKKEESAINIFGLSLLFVALVTLLSFIILFLWGAELVKLSDHKEFKKYIFLIPPGIFLIGLNRSLLFWSLRRKYMKIIGLSKVFESTGKAGSSILFGFTGFSSLGLILGQLIGMVLSAGLFIFRFIKTDLKLLKSITNKAISHEAAEYSEFPRINVLLTITEMMQISGLIFVFSLFFDSSTLGEVSKSIRILLIPLTVISTSVAQVFYQKASKELANGIDISINLKKIVFSMFGFSLPFLIIFLIISPWLFGFVLGKDWIVAGQYARILAIWIFLKFVTGPINTIPLMINKQTHFFILSLIGNLLLILSIIIPGSLHYSVSEMLIIFSGVQVVFLIFLYFKVLSLFKSFFKNI